MSDPVTSPDTEKSSSKSTPIIGLPLKIQQQEPKTRSKPIPRPKKCPYCGTAYYNEGCPHVFHSRYPK